METARPAGPADRPELRRMWELAVAELDGQRGGSLLAGALTRPDPDTFLTEALSDPDRLLVLGFIDDVPVGMGSACVERNRREPVTNLELLFTEPDARQVGVGAAMVEVVAEWGSSRGAVGVDAPALPGNRSAKAFFEAQGFQARLLIMHRPEGGPARVGG
ncbi:MAG TPA: GNAT family N-acetyltransferase [Acidimicrobiales bacterium]|nr:GNAT family N-acetyltransferase [Acidimicrobiales bacterium]